MCVRKREKVCFGERKIRTIGMFTLTEAKVLLLDDVDDDDVDEKEKGRNETGRNQFDIGIDIVR